MLLLQERYVLSVIFVIVRKFSQKLQAQKLNMIKREKLARHPRTIWRIWACDVTYADFENSAHVRPTSKTTSLQRYVIVV